MEENTSPDTIQTSLFFVLSPDVVSGSVVTILTPNAHIRGAEGVPYMALLGYDWHDVDLLPYRNCLDVCSSSYTAAIASDLFALAVKLNPTTILFL